MAVNLAQIMVREIIEIGMREMTPQSLVQAYNKFVYQKKAGQYSLPAFSVTNYCRLGYVLQAQSALVRVALVQEMSKLSFHLRTPLRSKRNAQAQL